MPAAGPHARAPARRRAARARPRTPTPAIERFYRRAARAEIAPRLDAATARAGTTLRRPDDPRPAHALGVVLVRRAGCRSTGGCCSRPAEILDYVVEHEVCHLEVMDHSPRFWALLESRVPDWRRHAAWLRRYGSTLVL